MKVFNIIKSFVLLVTMVLGFSSCEEKPVEVVPVTGIEITPKDTTIGLGETMSIRVNVLPENATEKGYRLLVNETDIISMEGAEITGLKAGTAYITAITDDGGKIATAKIKVKEPEPLVFGLEATDVTYSDITVRVSASDENARYWMWCAAKSEVGDLDKDGLLSYDQRLIDALRNAALEETGEVASLEDVLNKFTYTGSQDRSMSALLGEDLLPETEYVIWAYGIELNGKVTSEVFSIMEVTLEDPNAENPGNGEDDPGNGEDGPGNGEDNPGNGEDDPGNGEDNPGNGEDNPDEPVDDFEDITFENNDFTVVITNVTSESITMDVTPTVKTTPYFAYYLKSSELKGSGWFAGLSDGQLVSELFMAEWIYDDLFKNQYTGDNTVEFTKNIKANTSYTILLFRGIGTLDGKLLKYEVKTPAAE